MLCASKYNLIFNGGSLKVANFHFVKGQPPSADLRYGEEETICPSTLIFDAIKH